MDTLDELEEWLAVMTVAHSRGHVSTERLAEIRQTVERQRQALGQQQPEATVAGSPTVHGQEKPTQEGR
jgi:DNA-binding GntR family transcriptional regulator